MPKPYTNPALAELGTRPTALLSTPDNLISCLHKKVGRMQRTRTQCGTSETLKHTLGNPGRRACRRVCSSAPGVRRL